MSLVFNVRPKIIPVFGKGVELLYPVRRIYCFGKNYDAHALEMGRKVNKGSALFFTKPTDSLVAEYNNFSSPTANLSMRYPTMTESYHHEVELVVAVGPTLDGKTSFTNIPVEEAHKIIYGYAVGLDMTRRDLQLQATENGFPWDLAKGAEDGAAISPLMRTEDLRKSCPKLFTNTHGDINSVICQGEITLSVNGQVRQTGNMNCMINAVDELVSMLSKYVTLEPGDLIYTGTPSGVSPVRRGDVIDAAIESIGSIKATIV